jgi:hypothetical protein
VGLFGVGPLSGSTPTEVIAGTSSPLPKARRLVIAVLVLVGLFVSNPLRSRLWAVATIIGVFMLGVGLLMTWVGPAPITMNTVPA